MGGAGQPACGKTTQDGYRVAQADKDVNCPKCREIAERAGTPLANSVETMASREAVGASRYGSGR